MRLKLLYYYSAYEVLSDPKKKKQYDQFGENFNKRDEHQDFAYNFNFDDFMKNFHENFGDFHQHFHTQNRKTNGRKTPEMFNFGNIFNRKKVFFLSESNFYLHFYLIIDLYSG